MLPDSVYKDLCPAGFYCAEATTYVNRYKFRCPVGFYCPEGTGARDDLKRALLQGVVCVNKRDFYLAQKVSQFCLRQIMRNRFEFVALEQLRLARANLPLIDKKEMVEIQSSWIEDFDLQYCQEDAVMAVWEKYYSDDVKGNDVRAGILAMISAIQSVDFLKAGLLYKLLLSPETYRNKCSEHSQLLGGTPFPARECFGDANCNNVSQLECLCTAKSTALMLNCFDGDYPAASCVSDAGMEDSMCLDPSTDIKSGGSIDDFDLMAGHYLSYVQSSLKEEMQARYAETQATVTRCPFGTMTISDGSMQLGDCVKRKSVTYVQEQLDMIVQRFNPVDTFLSPKKWVTAAGDPAVNEGEFRPVYFAAAGSVSLITFDVRHLPDETRYGKHFRIKFLVAKELDPLYTDPIECDSLVAKRTPQLRDLDILLAESRGCAEISLPPAFVQEGLQHAESGGQLASGVFTFMLHPIVDIQWRVEVQIVDGVFQPDAFMLLSSALVEYAEPARAEVGTSKSFAIKLSSELTLELPANMPMKSFSDGANQRVITKAFLNWLPVSLPVANYMRPLTTAVAGGEMEYVFPEKAAYWRDRTELFLPYLPYFSNCRGFGRTIPLWTITEQTRGCKWAPEGGEIGLLSLGSQAKGDSCSLTEVECILDEVPSVKLSNPRWFETATGAKLFEVTKESFLASNLNNFDVQPVTEPVYLQQGIPKSGALPGRVTIAFQYWQRGPGEKMLSAGRAWFSEFVETPDVTVSAGRAEFTYQLSVVYYPMTHFEVMVYFAFPTVFYIGFYISMGVLSPKPSLRCQLAVSAKFAS
ncbi:unnamed protein product [Effrenium voratum]|uniref:Uncharacterized protein n=1 Tax=Effrenium voratum TaxID=2562239 RepID=A0AA36IG54_9DINO|nr:unnamed protein product [Effrenium voratum]